MAACGIQPAYLKNQRDGEWVQEENTRTEINEQLSVRKYFNPS